MKDVVYIKKGKGFWEVWVTKDLKPNKLHKQRHGQNTGSNIKKQVIMRGFYKSAKEIFQCINLYWEPVE